MNIEEKRILKTLTYYYGAGFADFPQFFDAIDEFSLLWEQTYTFRIGTSLVDVPITGN